MLSDTDRISLKEIIALKASIAHRKGKRVGPNSLLVEVQPGNKESHLPFFSLVGD